MVSIFPFRLPDSDESEEDYQGQFGTVKSIYLTPRNEEFIRHLKKEKERQRRQEMSIYRFLSDIKIEESIFQPKLFDEE